MTEKVKGFFELNMKWLVTIAFFTGVNVATITLAVENKIDKEEAKAIIDERLSERAYPLLEGKLTEKDIKQLQSDISEIKKIVKKIAESKNNDSYNGS